MRPWIAHIYYKLGYLFDHFICIFFSTPKANILFIALGWDSLEITKLTPGVVKTCADDPYNGLSMSPVFASLGLKLAQMGVARNERWKVSFSSPTQYFE